MNLFSTSPAEKPRKIYVVLAFTEDCSFVERAYRYKCEALRYKSIADGNPDINPYVTARAIEEVMLY